MLLSSTQSGVSPSPSFTAPLLLVISSLIMTCTGCEECSHGPPPKGQRALQLLCSVVSRHVPVPAEVCHSQGMAFKHTPCHQSACFMLRTSDGPNKGTHLGAWGWLSRRCSSWS